MKQTLIIFFLLLSFIAHLHSQKIKREFTGTMKGRGDLKTIELKLNFNNDSIEGIYYYLDIGTDLAIRGSLKNDTLLLEEHNSAGKTTGYFTGVMQGDSIAGNWIRTKDQSAFKFSIKEVEYKDYKLIKRNVTWYRNKKKDPEEKMIYSEWLEMSGNPNTEVQKIFNSLPGNSEALEPDKKTEAGKGFYGIEIDGDLYYFTNHQEVTLQLKTNEFISYGTYNSDFWGGSTDNRMGYTLFDLTSSKRIHLKDILRTDTASFEILRGWLCSAMKKKGTWTLFQSDFGNLADFIAEGKTPLQEQFYLKEDGVYFFFCRLPYSNIFSIDDIKIEYHQFIHILAKESCIYKWLMNGIFAE